MLGKALSLGRADVVGRVAKNRSAQSTVLNDSRTTGMNQSRLKKNHIL